MAAGLLEVRHARWREFSSLDGFGSKSPDFTDRLEIGALVFRCQTMECDVESGIEMDRCTFLRLACFGVGVDCRACRQRHEFKVANGHLQPFGQTRPRKGTTETGGVRFVSRR